MTADEERKFTITNSSTQYWMFHEFHKKITVKEFESLANENLPKSFLWLLDECAARLRADRKTLYWELIFVESMLCMSNADESYDKALPMKISKREW